MLTHKTCTGCKVHKPITEFNPVKTGSSRYRTQCKECVSKYNKKLREATKKEMKGIQFDRAHATKVGRFSELRVQVKCLKEKIRITKAVQQQRGFDLVVLTGPQTHDRWQVKTAWAAGTSKYWARVGDPSLYEYLVVVHPDPNKDMFWKIPSNKIPGKKPIRVDNRWIWE